MKVRLTIMKDMEVPDKFDLPLDAFECMEEMPEELWNEFCAYVRERTGFEAPDYSGEFHGSFSLGIVTAADKVIGPEENEKTYPIFMW